MMTIGINYSQMHDSSACIVRDGELLFAVAEERISRIKHHAGFPRLAIQAVTGVPVIMNTSFNLRGQAIVHTPTDALRTFSSSGMDGLVIGSFLGEK